MRTVVLAQLRSSASRLIATILAIVLAVAFVVATLVLGSTSRATVLRAVGAQYVGTDVVVSATGGRPLDAAALRGLPGVGAVAPSLTTAVQALLPDRSASQYVQVDAVAAAPALQWQRMTSGALPTRPGELAVAAGAQAEVGDTVPVTTYGEDGAATTSQTTVVGVVDLRGDPAAVSVARAFAAPEQVRTWGSVAAEELRVAATPGTAPADLAGDVSRALGPEVTVRTGEQAAEAQVATYTGDASVLTSLLLVFATVAVLVAGLVIANTFAVLLAQHTRELALLRCVGATPRQVRRSVLAEALVTGLGASVLGMLAGIGLAAAVSGLVGSDSPVPLEGVAVPPYVVLLGLAVGTGVTVVAALGPARAATRVAPLAALRPADAAPLRSRTGARRLALALLLLLPGVALLVVGVGRAELLMSLPGGVLSFLGVLLLAQRAVPAVVAVAGRLAGRVGGVPARLAAGNALRQPRRTAATATALIIGVTLTTSIVVAAASTRATVSAELTAQYPTDVVVAAFDALPPELLGRLESVDGVTAGLAVRSAELPGPDGEPVTVEGVDEAAARAVLRSQRETPLPREGEVVVPAALAGQWSLAPDAPVTVAGRRYTGVPGQDGYALQVTTGELSRLAPSAEVTQVWLRLDDGADARAAVGAVSDLVAAAVPDARVDGLAAERAAVDQILDVLLLVVTGLLAVAVVIALIGVGNTLALSVVERRQETGLLRAVGLTRRQLKQLLAWEAGLVAGVAAVLGVALGGAYGMAGTASALGGQASVVLAVPWLQVVAIVVVATVAGLLASVLPARRAARTSPVVALAG